MFKSKKPHTSGKHPSLPVPGRSNDPGAIGGSEHDAKEPPKPPCWKRCCNYMYDREKKTFCGRTCKSWISMIIYTIMYLLFLSTYTLIFLYGSLSIIKYMDDYQSIDKIELLTYSTQGIGLSATPTSVNNMPLISYRNDPEDYKKYVNAIEGLFIKRRKREVTNYTDLGPCGVYPFGYGSDPCILIRINKQNNWSATPLSPNMTANLNVPLKVRDWLKENRKLWLHCEGLHSYDKDHIGSIKYYPDPPGFDPELFPLDRGTESPLVAVQISNFTLGLSLAIDCKLWYREGVSSIKFMLYVTPKRK